MKRTYITILLAAIISPALWLLSTMYVRMATSRMADYSYKGFPLKYVEEMGWCNLLSNNCLKYNWTNLGIDIALHIVAALIVAAVIVYSVKLPKSKNDSNALVASGDKID